MYATREEWLQAGIKKLRPLFTEIGFNDLPETIHISVGWPSGRVRAKNKKIAAECWAAETSIDANPHIFISPELSDPIDVLGTLTHELVHAGGIRGHGSDYRMIALGVGLTGRMTETVPSDSLSERLEGIYSELGPYPHASLEGLRAKPTQKTYLLKVECDDDGYKMRVTQTWLMQAIPDCPLCGKQMTVEWKD